MIITRKCVVDIQKLIVGTFLRKELAGTLGNMLRGHSETRGGDHLEHGEGIPGSPLWGPPKYFDEIPPLCGPPELFVGGKKFTFFDHFLPPSSLSGRLF